MSQGSVWKVQYGLWNNHDYDSVLGTTLTATNRYGFLLISFITIFISFLGGQIWQMICFCLHQLRATPEPRDGLHHQIQAILRNSQSASATMLDFLRLARAWNSNTQRPIRRLLPWVILAGLESASFTVAGIFANNIVGISHVVLLRPGTCGYTAGAPNVGSYNAQDWDKLNVQEHEQRLSITGALDYVRSCYSSDLAKSDICDMYAVASLPATFQSVSCPFDEAICVDPSPQGSYQFTSDIINSNYQLGINAPPTFSVNYQRQTTCSPLQTIGYNSTEKDTTIVEDDYLFFFYGPMPPPWNTDYTWSYQTLSTNFTNSPFSLDTRTYFNGDSPWANASSDFRPITELNNTYGDVTLIFLVNNALFTGPVYDPWYFAQVEEDDTKYYLGGKVWVAQNPVSVMGCVETHRWCNPAIGNGTKSCSDWGPFASLFSYTSLSAEQRPVADEMLNSALFTTNIGNIIEELDTDSLTAWLEVDSDHTLLTSKLSDNQWQNDIQNWMNITLAQIQRSVVSVVTGPSLSEFNQYIDPPNANFTDVFNVCTAQKVQDQRFYSFSVCWLIVLLSFGTFVIVCNMFLPRATGWMRTKFHVDEEKKEDWDKDHILQIQRMAYEANNLGKWRSSKGTDYDSAVPITSPGSHGMSAEVFGKPNRKSSSELLGMQLHSRRGYKARGSDDDMLRHLNGNGVKSADNGTGSVLGRGFTSTPPTGEAPWDEESPPPTYGGFPFPHVSRIVSSGSADMDNDTQALLRHDTPYDSKSVNASVPSAAAATGHRGSSGQESLTRPSRAYPPTSSPSIAGSAAARGLGLTSDGAANARYMRVVPEEEEEQFDQQLFNHPADGSVGGRLHGYGMENNRAARSSLGPKVDDQDITHMGIWR